MEKKAPKNKMLRLIDSKGNATADIASWTGRDITKLQPRMLRPPHNMALRVFKIT